MQASIRVIGVVALVSLVGAACNGDKSDSNSGSSSSSGDSSAGSTTAPTTTAPTTTDAPTSTTGSTSTADPTDSTGDTTGPLMCPDNLKPAVGSEFCLDEASTPNCDVIGPEYQTQVCGVPVLPATELGRSMGVVYHSGDGPPDLGCFEPANYPKQGTSQLVTMTGVARLFSHGCESKGLAITVFEADGAGLGQSPPGALVVTALDCTVDGLATPDADCGTRYECKFEIPGVPTEKPLVIISEGPLWARLHEFNVYIPNAEVKGGVWTHDVLALASDDYNVLAQAALGQPATPGNGIILGETHDCGDVRLTGASVGLDVAAEALTYFNDDELHPLPAPAATTTDTTGLYAAFDVAPGEVSVAAIGNMLGVPTTVGHHRVSVFPDSVTYLTFRGVRPYQVGP